MNGKTAARKPRSRSGSAASNSESELTLGSTAQCTTADSMSEHSIALPNSRQSKHQQTTHAHCMSVVEQGATGDGVHPPPRPDPSSSSAGGGSSQGSCAHGGQVDSSPGSSRPPDLDFSDPVFKKLARINGEINRMHKDQLRGKLAELRLNTRGVKEVLKKRLKNYYRRKKLAAANVGKGAEQVPYNFLVVIDFEATCQESNDHFVQEIIEFPAVLVEVQQKEIVGMFREFCKPVINPVLTDFCKQLTGVNQSEVDSASEFPVVLQHFEQWLDSWEMGTTHTFCVVTDGPWDIHRFLSKQCEISQLPFPTWSRRWINVRKSYGNFYATGRLNLHSMLENLGLRFEGRPHCGLDDSKNIAAIVCHMLQDGCALKVNEKLDGHPDFSQPHGCGDQKPSGDFSPLIKEEMPVAVRTASSHCKPGSQAGMDRQKSARDLPCVDSEEDIADLLYYFKLQSA